LGRLDAAHPGLRYHVLQASARLGCLTPAVIGELSRTDPDAEVRALAHRLLTATRD
jgi:hypothetical protein